MEMETSVTSSYTCYNSDYMPARLNIPVCRCVCYCLSETDHVVSQGLFSLSPGFDVHTRCLTCDYIADCFHYGVRQCLWSRANLNQILCYISSNRGRERNKKNKNKQIRTASSRSSRKIGISTASVSCTMFSPPRSFAFLVHHNK